MRINKEPLLKKLDEQIAAIQGADDLESLRQTSYYFANSVAADLSVIITAFNQLAEKVGELQEFAIQAAKKLD